MALSHELPIYRACYELLRNLVELQNRLPRTVRFSIGQRTVDYTLDMLGYVYEANSAADKLPALGLFIMRYDQVTMLMRLLLDTRHLSPRQSVPFVRLLDSIGKQATAWKKHCSRQP